MIRAWPHAHNQTDFILTGLQEQRNAVIKLQASLINIPNGKIYLDLQISFARGTREVIAKEG